MRNLNNLVYLLIFMSAFGLSCNGQQQYAYIGKVYSGLHGNNVAILKHDFDDGLLFREYFLERSDSLKFYTEFEVDAKGNQKLIKDSNSVVGEKYILTNLITGVCTDFDLSTTEPKIIGTYKVQDKNRGTRVAPELMSAHPKIDMDKLIMAGDTSINGQDYKILKDTTFIEKSALGFPKYLTTLYINTKLKDFSFHLSKAIDAKYDGFLTRVDYLCWDKNIKEKKTISFVYDFKPGLNDKEIALVKKYIALVKKAK